MKKIMKSRIFIFILTAIMFTSIGVYATTTYKASDGTSMNVNDALNELYNKENNDSKTYIISTNTMYFDSSSYTDTHFYIPCSGYEKLESNVTNATYSSALYYGVSSDNKETLLKTTNASISLEISNYEKIHILIRGVSNSGAYGSFGTNILLK